MEVLNIMNCGMTLIVMEKISKCPVCGDETVGNGSVLLIEEDTFKRTCRKCGWEIRGRVGEGILVDSDNSSDLLIEKVNWKSFLYGEVELECECEEDAKLLLSVCKANGIHCAYIEADDFESEPYWYVKQGSELTTSFLGGEDDSISICWTVRQYIEEHIAL